MNEDRDINKEKIMIEDKSIMEITNQGKNKMEKDINKVSKKIDDYKQEPKKIINENQIEGDKTIEENINEGKIKKDENDCRKFLIF